MNVESLPPVLSPSSETRFHMAVHSLDSVDRGYQKECGYALLDEVRSVLDAGSREWHDYKFCSKSAFPRHSRIQSEMRECTPCGIVEMDRTG